MTRFDDPYEDRRATVQAHLSRLSTTTKPKPFEMTQATRDRLAAFDIGEGFIEAPIGLISPTLAKQLGVDTPGNGVYIQPNR